MAREGLVIILQNIGRLLQLMAALPLALIPFAVVFDEPVAIAGAVVTTIAFAAAGFLLARLQAKREPRLREGMLIAAVGWLLVPLGSALYFVIVEGWPFLDAYFECMSAWTGTGMSVIADYDALARTTFAWRSIMQWVGGLGVIVLTLSILARPGTGAFSLYASEGREDRLRPSIVSTVRTLWVVYVGYTIGAFFVLLWGGGIDPWGAFNHALTGIATGGMSIFPESIGRYDSVRAEIAVIVVMITGGIAFVAHYALLRGRWHAFFRDEQLQAMVFVLAIAVPLMTYFLLAPALHAGTALRAATFQVASAVSTTGFQTTDISIWPDRAKLALAGVMLLGGAAGSTAGGIKLVRGALLVKGAFWKLERAGLPHFAVTRFRWGGQPLTPAEANEEFAEAAFILVLWVTMLFIGIIAMLTLLPVNHGLGNILFEIASVQGNVGLSTGIVGATLPEAAKVALVGVMWAGRLEILPVLLLIRTLMPRFVAR